MLFFYGYEDRNIPNYGLQGGEFSTRLEWSSCVNHAGVTKNEATEDTFGLSMPWSGVKSVAYRCKDSSCQ
jgi:hypothetical protein